jgi:hypothetical protein
MPSTTFSTVHSPWISSFWPTLDDLRSSRSKADKLGNLSLEKIYFRAKTMQESGMPTETTITFLFDCHILFRDWQECADKDQTDKPRRPLQAYNGKHYLSGTFWVMRNDRKTKV